MKQLIAALRDYARARERGGALSRFESKLAVARHRFWSVVCGADIPLNCFQLGGGLLLPHPQGVVIHPNPGTGERAARGARVERRRRALRLRALRLRALSLSGSSRARPVVIRSARHGRDLARYARPRAHGIMRTVVGAISIVTEVELLSVRSSRIRLSVLTVTTSSYVPGATPVMSIHWQSRSGV